MTVKKDFESILQFDPDKVERIYEETLEVYQKHKPTTGEILIALSNLTYALGASIGNYDGKGPSLEELKQIYYQKPGRIDVAVMLQGMTMATWYDDWVKLRLESNQDKEGD